MEQLHPYTFGMFSPWFYQSDNIQAKPVPRWPYRASYRGQVRDARKRRAKGGGR